MMHALPPAQRAGRNQRAGVVAATPVKPKRLMSRCWCDSKDVHVAAELVRQGLTVSCGKHGCVQP